MTKAQDTAGLPDQFRKKPVVITASQWFKDGDHAEVTIDNDDAPGFVPPSHGWIKTLEGGHIVTPGDWIITGVKGEHYPCKPDIFEMTYERAALAAPVAAPEGWKLQRDELRELATVCKRMLAPDVPWDEVSDGLLIQLCDAALAASQPPPLAQPENKQPRIDSCRFDGKPPSPYRNWNDFFENAWRTGVLCDLRISADIPGSFQPQAQPVAEAPAETRVIAKPLSWAESGGDWHDKHFGFYVSHESDEDEPDKPWSAAMGEGDPERFATADEGKAWCQEQAESWVADIAHLVSHPAALKAEAAPQDQVQTPDYWRGWSACVQARKERTALAAAPNQEPAANSTNDNYRHFLSYSGAADSPWLRCAYFHGADKPCAIPAAPQEGSKARELTHALQLAREYVDSAAREGYDGIRAEARRKLKLIDAALSASPAPAPQQAPGEAE